MEGVLQTRSRRSLPPGARHRPAYPSKFVSRLFPCLELQNGRRRQCRAHDSAGILPLHCRSVPAFPAAARSEEHTSELQSLMRTSYAVFCLQKKKHKITKTQNNTLTTQETITMK